jgi:hypothetical protein
MSVSAFTKMVDFSKGFTFDLLEKDEKEVN